MVDGKVHKVKAEVTRELTKEVKDIVGELNEVTDLVAMLTLVQEEVVGEVICVCHSKSVLTEP